ncbi:serine/threonine protein phosphatase [Brevibacillus gelatini]|uniref:Serine/threonine protein phosphatase n=1 Tax=Brevibacillus gelatini TaxID=1655277 RepID=A0A3M8B7K5_9BACL|nr:metallophosphoesterase family protein [Brevibacillus gelatini]RNB59359.1 serine/threonine protein phosphatase [Brevibacillus gelatini]
MNQQNKRILAISDIHGMYDQFIKLLEKVNYSPTQDKLILLGDYVDRGKKSKEVIEKIIELANTYDVVVLRGNHDQMFLDWLITNDGMNEFNFFRNGGLQTVESYCGLDFFDSGIDTIKAKNFILKHCKHHVDFLKELSYFYETNDFIFVHAGLNPNYENWRLTPHEDMLWIRNLFHYHPTKTDKTIVFGHTPCINLHGKPNIWFADDKIGIDGGTAYGYQLNCLEITDGKYTQHFISSKEDANV